MRGGGTKQPSPPRVGGDVGNTGVTSGGLLVRVDSPQARTVSVFETWQLQN